MATGNVGKHLSDKEDEVHTFFSRDGGLTWVMARAGSHIYEYGDHGAILVIADDRRASKEIYYSWDEALTWNELTSRTRPPRSRTSSSSPGHLPGLHHVRHRGERE